MQLSRKQTILIGVLSGVVLLLTLAAVLIFTPGAEDEAAPTPAPEATATPAPTPTTAPTPTSTAFRLPLVPQWDTPWPTAEPLGAFGALVPPSAAPPEGDTGGPWVSASDERTHHILAVGLREGRTAALLLMGLTEDSLTVAALPTNVLGPRGLPIEETPLAGEDVRAQGQAAAELVAEATGWRGEGWLALDLGCLPAVLRLTGPLSGQGAEALQGDGQQRAQGVLALATGAAVYGQRASLLQLPALKRAVGDGFASSLSGRALWGLLWTLRRGAAVRGLLAPTAGQRVDLSGLKKIFGESS